MRCEMLFTFIRFNGSSLVIIIITSEDPLNGTNVNSTHNDLDKFPWMLGLLLFSTQHRMWDHYFNKSDLSGNITGRESKPSCPSALGTCALNNYNWEIFKKFQPVTFNNVFT